MMWKRQPQISEAETGFIEAITDNPRDDSARLVYADWLEERNDPRCEYLRKECEFAELAQRVSASDAPPDPELSQQLDQLRQEIRTLRHGFHNDWLSQMSRSKVACCSSEFYLDFECPMTWGELRPTRQADVRYCDVCDSKVYFVTSEKAAFRRAHKGHCVCLVSDLPPDKKLQHAFDDANFPSLLGELA